MARLDLTVRREQADVLETVVMESLETRLLMSVAPLWAPQADVQPMPAQQAQPARMFDLGFGWWDAPDLTGEVQPGALSDVVLPGDVAEVNLYIDNIGDGWAQDELTVDLYLSTDLAIDDGDILVGSLSDPWFNLGPDESALYQPEVSIPSWLAEGDYFLVADIDADGLIDEDHEWNNLVSTDLFVGMPVYDIAQPDIVGDIVSTTLGDVIAPGQRGSVTIELSNIGDGWPWDDLAVDFYLSSDTTFDDQDVLLGGFFDPRFDVWPGESARYTARVTVPIGTDRGDYYLLANVDADDHIVESDEDNNLVVSDNTFEVAWLFGTFPGASNLKQTLEDADGTLTTFSLAGPGFGEVLDVTDAGFQLQFNNTTTKSAATVTTGRGTTTSLASVDVLGSMKSLVAKTADLRGNVTVDGTLGTLTMDDVEGPSTITIGAQVTTANTATLTFDQVADLSVISDTPIKTLQAVEWLNTDDAVDQINAPWLTTLKVTGAGSRGLRGDFEVDVTAQYVTSMTIAGDMKNSLITLTQTPGTRAALGTLTIKGWMDNSWILSSGNIGAVTVGGLNNAILLAGVGETFDNDGDGVLDLPYPAIDLTATATIKTLTVKGIKQDGLFVDSVINSNIAAATMGTLSLSYVQTDNGGVPFGLAADTIRRLTLKGLDGTQTFSYLASGESFADGDFEVRLA